jgi:hypothetical protein
MRTGSVPEESGTWVVAHPHRQNSNIKMVFIVTPVVQNTTAFD